MGKKCNFIYSKWVAIYGLPVIASVILPLQIGLLVFFLLFPGGVLFFLFLKMLFVCGIAILLIEHKKPAAQDFYDMLVFVPGMWAALSGILSSNPGVHYEMPVYVMAPIAYLLVFRFTSISFFKLILPILKIICAIILAIFFFLYFMKGGTLYSILRDHTHFLVQQHDGFNKVLTIHATQLVFLLPVMLVHFYFERNLINFILVVGCMVMALLIGRKSILIMLMVLFFVVFMYSLFSQRKLSESIKFGLPFLVSIIIFSNISHFDNRKFSDAMFNSFPSLSPSQYNVDSVGQYNVGSVGQYNVGSVGVSIGFPDVNSIDDGSDVFANLYESDDNICSSKNAILLSRSSDKRGAVIRQNQIKILIYQIGLSPWVGHGLGYLVPQCIRSKQYPWRFELTYLGVAMNVGLVGLFVYCLVYIRWTIGVLSSNLDRRVCLPLLCGSLFFLICSATNPYILSVENLLIFFVPYMLLHVEGRGALRGV